MKNLVKTFALAGLFLFAASLKNGQGADSPQFKNEGHFSASIDGKRFDSRNKYTAEVVNRSEYSKHEQSTALTFFGGTYYDQSGNSFEESLQLQYAFADATVGNVSGQKIVFHFNNQKFLSIPGQTKIRVTNVHYNADRTAMILSAEFEGKMLEWVKPGESQPIVNVKGKFENINVTVPTSAPTAQVDF